MKNQGIPMTKTKRICWWGAIVLSILFMASPTSEQCFSANDLGPASVSSVVAGYTDFAVELFKGLSKGVQSPLDNIFFSPVSIWSALMVTYLGAQGVTESELTKALGLGTNKGGVANTFLGMLKEFSHNRNLNYTLRIANKLYFDQTVTIRDCIQQNLQEEIERKDFIGHAESARMAINRWVEIQTNNKIKDLLPMRSVTALTRMIIANAAYFKGFWQTPFAPEHTRKGNFFVQPNKIQPTNMMYQEETFPYAEDPFLGVKAVELPYAGQEVSMIILLPDSSVEELVPKMSATALDALFSHMTPELVRIAMPKFKIEETVELTNTLSRMGIRDLFDPTHADLSGFTGQSGSYVQAVLHKAFIDVNEEGTEAAAATSLITTYSIKLSKSFLVNKPFVFLIRDKVQNIVLFIGLIRNPKAV